MSAERFFDDLARTLAEPMPRRRAVRVLGASLVAIAVPGISPRAALAAPARSNAGCPGDIRMCPTVVSGGSGPDLPCGPPARRYECPNPFGTSKKCVDLCAKDIPCNSSKEGDDGCSFFTCCSRKLFVDCKNEECVPCASDEKLCVTGNRGKGACCARGERCCFNGTSAACCGPDQKCTAQPGKRATCSCKPGKGTTCDSDCCGSGETCCDNKKCCKPGEACCNGECCSAGEKCCAGNVCCTAGETCCGLTCCGSNEWCLHKRSKTIFSLPTCKPTCAPGNRAGKHCCGTGFEPNRAKTKCVPA